MSGAGLSESPKHALTWGMRRVRDEVQLTNAIAAIASTDQTFAAQFVDALLAQAANDCPDTRAAQRRLGAVPARLVGDRERRLVGREGEALGFVDLIFEEPTDDSEFTLLVENKLYSVFGPEQLRRYRDGLRAVRSAPGAEASSR